MSRHLALDPELFAKTTVAALSVITGVVIKNSSEQMKRKDKMLPIIGMLLFAFGWIYLPYVLSKGRSKNMRMHYVIPSVAILLSVVAMKKLKLSKNVKMALGAVFAISWLYLGYRTGKPINLPLTGLTIGALVLLSMMVFLPFQRKHGVVDGPGMVLFCMAWFGMVMLNSMRTIKMNGKINLPMQF